MLKSETRQFCLYNIVVIASLSENFYSMGKYSSENRDSLCIFKYRSYHSEIKLTRRPPQKNTVHLISFNGQIRIKVSFGFNMPQSYHVMIKLVWRLRQENSSSQYYGFKFVHNPYSNKIEFVDLLRRYGVWQCVAKERNISCERQN